MRTVDRFCFRLSCASRHLDLSLFLSGGQKHIREYRLRITSSKLLFWSSAIKNVARFSTISLKTRGGKKLRSTTHPCRLLESVSRSEEHTSELQSRLHLVCRL